MLMGPLLPITFIVSFQYDRLYGNLQLRVQKEAARMIKEEPERFFMPEGNGIVTREEYHKIVGLPKDYKPKITHDNQFGHLNGQNPLQVIFKDIKMF